MAMGTPAYRDWWKKIGAEYKVTANIGVEGKVYEKYGTTFGTRLLVIDKVKPDGTPSILAEVASVEDLMRTLEPIRDARPQAPAEQPASEPPSAQVAQGGEGRPGTGAPPPTRPKNKCSERVMRPGLPPAGMEKIPADCYGSPSFLST
jgi:hypothetical protein